MHKGKILQYFENSKFTRICMENHPNVTGTGGKSCFFHKNPIYIWQPLQSLLLKIYRLPYFDMPYQFLLKSFFQNKLLSCLQKVDHTTHYCEFSIWYIDCFCSSLGVDVQVT